MRACIRIVIELFHWKKDLPHCAEGFDILNNTVEIPTYGRSMAVDTDPGWSTISSYIFVLILPGIKNRGERFGAGQ